MGYHNREIPRGVYGEFSKIKEEFLESEDAFEQGNKIMLLVELSDLIGAIESFSEKNNISLDDLIKMKNATKRAFSDGTRKPRN
jgi:phosphoribosyl-ATP pyrophosphohydrolase